MKKLKPAVFLALLFVLTGCKLSQPDPTAFVAVSNSAKAGGMRITAIDGESVAATDGHYVLPGSHQFKVACQLDNGVGASFGFEVELLPHHSYCFASRDQGKSCTIIYTQVTWEGGGIVLCQ